MNKETIQDLCDRAWNLSQEFTTPEQGKEYFRLLLEQVTRVKTELKLGDRVRAYTIYRVKDKNRRYWQEQKSNEIKGWFIGKTTLSNGERSREDYGDDGSYDYYTVEEAIAGAWIWDGRKPIKVFLSSVEKI